MAERPAGEDEKRAESEPEAASSIGKYLALQRRLRGISLDELAERTRIPRRNLERLESGAFDAKPDGFVRGFVRTVAEALGLDPRDAVMRLAEEPSSADEDALRARHRRAALVVTVLVLLVVALGVAGLRLAVRWMAAPGEDGSKSWVYRRDAVRSLAESASAGGARSEAEPSEVGRESAGGARSEAEPSEVERGQAGGEASEPASAPPP